MNDLTLSKIYSSIKQEHIPIKKKKKNLWFWYLAKKEDGLGIQPHVNQALMGKGLWIAESQSLWKKILEAKYEVTREGWEL